jgi:hypothetical protein
MGRNDVAHALIIGDDGLSAGRVEAQLWASGYSSVAHAWTESDAWDSIAYRRPVVIVLLAEPGCSPPVDALSRLSRAADAPVLVAARGREQALACIGNRASLEGPYPLEQIDEAVRVGETALAA